MNARARISLRGEKAVIATMHGKQRVIAPLLERFLGLDATAPPGLDTDQFGTFARDVPRLGTPLEAARWKIRDGFALMPGARIGVASEGSFGCHPAIPFVPWGHEWIVLQDRATGWEVTGQHTGPAWHFAHFQTSDLQAALAFAHRVGFPRQGVIVMGVLEGVPSLAASLHKDCTTVDELARVVTQVLARHAAVSVETDMRAHRNPLRMRCIRRAIIDLLRAFRSGCPSCGRPGFVVHRQVPGLACSSCGCPTRAVRSQTLRCHGCGYEEDHPVPSSFADPAQCDRCNP